MHTHEYAPASVPGLGAALRSRTSISGRCRCAKRTTPTCERSDGLSIMPIQACLVPALRRAAATRQAAQERGKTLMITRSAVRVRVGGQAGGMRVPRG